KNTEYSSTDMQLRINPDNTVTFGTGDASQSSRVQSSAKRVTGGYVVEAAITMPSPNGLSSVHGLDFQVNDASGGTRTAVKNWTDDTGNSWSSPEYWGVGTFVAGALQVDVREAFVAPTVDGTVDSVWSTANTVKTERQTEGTGGASAEVKT